MGGVTCSNLGSSPALWGEVEREGARAVWGSPEDGAVVKRGAGMIASWMSLKEEAGVDGDEGQVDADEGQADAVIFSLDLLSREIEASWLRVDKLCCITGDLWEGVSTRAREG